MDLDSLIIQVFCWIDEAVKAVVAQQPRQRLRRRGFAPTLSDSEVLTMEVVGAYLGYSEEAAMFDYFRRHYPHFFPILRQIHRTSFTRQAANLYKLKEAVWQHLLEQRASLPPYVIVDSVPVPVCRFARAPRCERFRGEADYGHDWVGDHVYYGFRLHALVDPEGLIRCLYLTSARGDEKDALEDMIEGKAGRVLGDRNFWSPDRQAFWRENGVAVIAPFKHKKHDPQPRWSTLLSGLRRRVETVFSQFTERYELKRVRAKDLWHLASRLLRCTLSHTVMALISRQLGHSTLRLAQLLSS
jgi:hypothetical protein